MLDFGFYNIDCMEGMAQFPDKYFELAIVDPPYGININMNMGRRKGQAKRFEEKKWDNGIPDAEYFSELQRVSANQIIWGGNYFTEFLSPSDSWIIWDKENPGLSFAEGEMAWTNKKCLVRFFRHHNTMVDCGGKIHPTQKPIKLYEWLLINYAKQGDKILDTHVGSASSLIACYNLGFDYVGFEIDKDYYTEANKRIEAVKSQVRFDFGQGVLNELESGG